MNYRMVFDSGSKSLKCAIADNMGEIIALESIVPEVLITEDGLGRHWNHNTYWLNLLELAKLTIKSADIDPGLIKYITACSIRPSCVFTDEENKALYIGASFDVLGMEAADEIEEKLEEITAESFYNLTGHFPSMLFPAARYAVLIENKEIIGDEKQITQYLPMDSWILVKFGAEIHTNYASAVESGFFDLKEKYWFDAWSEIFDIPENFFPFPVKSGEIVGNVSSEVQTSLGLSPDCVLVAGLPDTHAAMLASNSLNPGSTGIILGSTTPVQTICSKMIIDPDMRAWSSLISCKNICEKYIIETNTGITGQILKWAAQIFGLESDESLNDKFSTLNRLYDDFDLIEFKNSPEYIKTNCIYAYLGPSALAPTKAEMGLGRFYMPPPGGIDEIEGDQRQFVGAIFDNILFAIYGNIIYAQEFSLETDFQYAILGGMARSETLVQRFADILGAPVKILDSHEATIRGLLSLCDIADNIVTTPEEFANYLNDHSILRTVNPRHEMNEKMHQKYQDWKKIQKTL